MSDRRRFLQAALGLMAAPACGAFAAPPSAGERGRVLLLFLRGGLDGLFAFAPVADPRLESLRPTLARQVIDAGLPLGSTGFSAHPAAARLAELFQQGELSFAPCAGTTDRSRSHFQAQDLFELGTGDFRGRSGFLARAADQLGGARQAISFTTNLPLIYRGARQLPAVAALGGSGFEMRDERGLDAIRAMHRAHDSGAAIERALSTRAEIQPALETGMDPRAARGASGIAGLPEVAAAMGRILRLRPSLALAFIDVGGFDTHAREEDSLNRHLPLLGDSLLALRSALGPEEWARTRVVVISEFGRTARENGSGGTDHGRGGLALVAGGALAGGRQLGDFAGLQDSALNEARDLPVHVDWRHLIGDVLREQLDLPPRALASIFPGLS